MYDHPATQANIATLKSRGVSFAGPAEGRMASGLVGPGRLLEPAELLGYIRLTLGKEGLLSGRKVVVTAGPTREPLDPVRFFSNRSTGKQGLALAQAVIDAGGSVTLITGPVEGPIPIGVDHVAITTAVEMRSAVLEAAAKADALLMAAAVSDFRPASVAEHKIKKKIDKTGGMAIALERNPDILLAVKEHRERSGFPRLTVGFAADTNRVLEHGRGKLLSKGLDLIAINDVSAGDAGFAVDTNRIIVLNASGETERWPLLTKSAVADRLVEAVAELLIEKETRAG